MQSDKKKYDEYNEFITVRQRDRSEWPEVTKSSFSEFFSKHLDMLNEENLKNGRETITRNDIAKMLGMGDEGFRKIISRTRETKRRDCIIAICAALGADTKDTDYALYCYNMPVLNDYNRRDELLMELLDSQRENRRTIEQINSTLKLKHYPELDIIHNKKKAAPIVYPYKKIRTAVQNDCVYNILSRLSSEIEDEIHEMSDPLFFGCVRTSMEFDNNGEKIVIWIRAFNQSGEFRKKSEKMDYNYFYCNVQKEIVKEFSSFDETAEFQGCFNELKVMAEDELKRIEQYLWDTRNFSYRIGRKVIDDELHIIAEIYNNIRPTLKEYYMMDYCGGKYSFTVSSKSRFMKKMLDKDIYESRYSSFNSDADILEEYRDFVKTHDNFFRHKNRNRGSFDRECDISISRLKYYDLLEKKIGNYAVNLCAGSVVMTEEKTDYDKYKSLISSMGAEKQFECVFEEANNNSCIREKVDLKSYIHALNLDALEYYWMYNEKPVITRKLIFCKPSTEINFSDGRSAELTLLDLEKGWNLGLRNIDDVGRFLMKNKTLDISKLLNVFEDEVKELVYKNELSEASLKIKAGISDVNEDERRIYLENLLERIKLLSDDYEKYESEYIKEYEAIQFRKVKETWLKLANDLIEYVNQLVIDIDEDDAVKGDGNDG